MPTKDNRASRVIGRPAIAEAISLGREYLARYAAITVGDTARAPTSLPAASAL